MRTLGFSAPLLICLAFTGRAWLVAGLIADEANAPPAPAAGRKADDTKPKELKLVRPYVVALDGFATQRQLQVGPSLDELTRRYNESATNPYGQLGSMPGEMIPAESRAIPMPNMLEIETQDEFHARAARNGWQPQEINGLTFYFMPLVDVSKQPRWQAVATPAIR